MPLYRRSFLLSASAALLSSAAHAQTRFDGARVARALAELVELEYPDAAAGTNAATRLRDQARRRAYAQIPATELAQRLTTDLRAVIGDQHLSVTYAPDEADTRSPIPRGQPTPDPAPPAIPGPRAREIFDPMNYGVRSARVMEENIGVLEVDTFAPLYNITREKFGAAMTLLAQTSALIIDLRANGGGHASSSNYLTSYFFDRDPFLLSRMIWRRLPADENRTTRDLVGPNYGEQRPVFVLTSSNTFSAAEAVAYDLQTLGRARIVGEQTRGGANPGDFFNIGQGFVAFVPQGHTQSSRTGGSWEGVGITPDIAASAANAVQIAHRAAIEAIR